MSSQTPDDRLVVRPAEKVGVGLPTGFSAHRASGFTPLAPANARRKIDPTQVSVAVSGLSQRQIDAVDFAALFRLDRCRALLTRFGVKG